MFRAAVRTAFILFLTLIACAPRARAAEPLRFCRAISSLSALFYIAQDQGFFGDEGVDAQFSDQADGTLCLNALIGGQADLAAPAETPFAYLSLNGADLQIVAFYADNLDVAVYVRQESGIRSFAGLRGKKIGFLPGTSSAMYLAAALEKEGMTQADVKELAMKTPVMASALAGGHIDAFVAWEPWGIAAGKMAPGGIVRLQPSLSYRPYGVLVASKTVLAKRGPQIKKALAALCRAEAFARAHPAAAQAITARHTHIEEDVVRTLWPHYDFKIGLESNLIAMLNDNARIIQRDDPNFKDKPLPDYRHLIAPTFLREVAPERVEGGM